jgi:hypothetical protein
MKRVSDFSSEIILQSLEFKKRSSTEGKIVENYLNKKNVGDKNY